MVSPCYSSFLFLLWSLSIPKYTKRVFFLFCFYVIHLVKLSTESPTLTNLSKSKSFLSPVALASGSKKQRAQIKLKCKEASFGAFWKMGSWVYKGTIVFVLSSFFSPSSKEVPKLLDISVLLLVKWGTFLLVLVKVAFK